MEVAWITEQIINGLLMGGIYGLVGLGMVLIFGVMGFVNFAHAEYLMLGAYVILWLVTATHLEPYIIFFTAGLVVAMIGIGFEVSLFRPLFGKPRALSLIVTLGLSVFLQVLMTILVGGVPRAVISIFTGQAAKIAGITISYQRLMACALAIFVGFLLHIFLQRTMLGKAVRATAQDAGAASLMGISIGRIYLLCFAMATGLAGIAGALVAPLFVVYPVMGSFFIMRAFAVTILGGMGSMKGALVAGFIIGLAETLGGVVLSEYLDAISFTIIIMVLLFKPGGLFAEGS